MLRHLARTMIVAAAPWLAFAAPVSAQDTSAVGLGDRVRVRTTEGAIHDGRIRLLNASVLEVQPENGSQAVSLPLTSVEGLQVHRGQRRSVGRGVFLGLAGGVALGALVGAVDGGCSELACSTGGNAALAAVFLGVLGIPLGAIVGAFVKTDRWDDAVLSPELRGSLSPIRQLQFSVSLRF